MVYKGTLNQTFLRYKQFEEISSNCSVGCRSVPRPIGCIISINCLSLTLRSYGSMAVLARMVIAITFSEFRSPTLTICKSKSPQPIDTCTFDYIGEIAECANNDRNRLRGGASTHM